MNLKKTNIGMLLEDSFTFDIRVEKRQHHLLAQVIKFIFCVYLIKQEMNIVYIYKASHVYRIGWGKK